MLRKLAKGESDARIARRLLAIANALDDMSREAAAQSAGMDRQTLRDWVIRYNEHGLDGLSDLPRDGLSWAKNLRHACPTRQTRDGHLIQSPRQIYCRSSPRSIQHPLLRTRRYGEIRNGVRRNGRQKTVSTGICGGAYRSWTARPFPLKQSRDAGVAETAIKAGLTLVTDDENLSRATAEHGGKVMSLAEFSALPPPEPTNDG